MQDGESGVRGCSKPGRDLLLKVCLAPKRSKKPEKEKTGGTCGVWWLRGKDAACQCRRQGFDPWVGKITARRTWQPAPVF